MTIQRKKKGILKKYRQSHLFAHVTTRRYTFGNQREKRRINKWWNVYDVLVDCPNVVLSLAPERDINKLHFVSFFSSSSFFFFCFCLFCYCFFLCVSFLLI